MGSEWLTTVGETAADFLNTKLDLGLTNTSVAMGSLLLAALAIQFRKDRYVPWIYWVAVWYAVEKTLSIHTIFTPRRELFYWTAILFTFALGTAAGDLLAEQLKLGYLHSAMVFGAGIGVTFAAYRLLNLNAVTAFWIAYILTRPFGASFGDLLSQPREIGGLGLGTVGTSAIFLGVILLLIVAMTKAQRRLAPIPVDGPRPRRSAKRRGFRMHP